MNIKNFALNRNKYKKGEKEPDYKISTKIGDKFVELGGGWIKKDVKGNTYLSCKLQDSWKDHTDESKSRAGYNITKDVKVEEGEATPKEMNSLTSEDENGRRMDVKDIPF